MHIEMKRIFCSLSAALLSLTLANASPIQKHLVPNDARWVLHLDIENFFSTQLGSFLKEEIIEKEFQEQVTMLQKFLTNDFSLSKLDSLTLYGTSFDDAGHEDFNGVILLKTQFDLEPVLDNLIEKSKQDNSLLIQTATTGQGTVYKYGKSLKDDAYGLVHEKRLLVLAKSASRLKRALHTVQSQDGQIETISSLKEFPPREPSFFFMAAAEGFNSIKLDQGPHAQVLKQTEKGRILIGESNEHMFVDLLLQTEETEGATKIHAILSGIKALIQLSNPDPRLVELVNAIDISVHNDSVHLHVRFPVKKAIETIREEHHSASVSHEGISPLQIAG